MEQRPDQSVVRKLSWLDCALVLSLWIGAFAISAHDTANPLRASLSLLRSSDFEQLLNSKAPFLDIKRTIQSHYLSYGVYIPLDDIVLNAQEKQPLRDLLESACKPGRATVWVPLKFHVPLAGEKVFEWCLVKV
jgi:hypothetical protein